MYRGIRIDINAEGDVTGIETLHEDRSPKVRKYAPTEENIARFSGRDIHAVFEDGRGGHHLVHREKE